MKKLARLTALLLTGALLLVLTACGAVTETEQQAKQRLLGEINSYRASIQLAPLDEVKQLSDAEQVWQSSSAPPVRPLCQKAKQVKSLIVGIA